MTARKVIPILLILFCMPSSARAAEPTLFANLPPDWKITQNVVLPPDQVAAIGLRLGAEVSSVSKTVLDVQGARLQVNVITCPKADAATKVDVGDIYFRQSTGKEKAGD